MKKILILFFITLLSIFPLASATQTTMQISPSSMVLDVGDTFNITIIVKPGQEVDTVAVDLLQWSAGIVDCISVQKGTIFDNPVIWMSGKINNTAGKLQYMVMASNVPASQEKQLCTITFQAKKGGISTISIQESGVARNGEALQKNILNSCQLTVNPSASNSTSNNTQTNQTEPITNETQDDDDNRTVIPISDTNNTDNDTNKTSDISPGLFDNIPPTTISYVIIAICIISLFAYIFIRHFQHKQEDKEDEEKEDVDTDTDLDSFIANNFGDGTNG